MNKAFTTIIGKCESALESPDPQSSVESILMDAKRDPAIVEAISGGLHLAGLDDLAIHRSEDVTLLASALLPGFGTGLHDHNILSVVSVCAGQEGNQYFEKDGDGLKRSGRLRRTGTFVEHLEAITGKILALSRRYERKRRWK